MLWYKIVSCYLRAYKPSKEAIVFQFKCLKMLKPLQLENILTKETYGNVYDYFMFSTTQEL